MNMISQCTFSEGGGGPGEVEVNSGRAENLGMGGWGACLRASTDGEGWPLCVRSNATSVGKKMQVSGKIETMLWVHTPAEGSTGNRQLELVTNKHIL